ncbi:MAG: low molecular weight phosphotyrosine protein phosphatase [Lachnospiraceae bacterium]|nr:low molecular weight phosphotyrosine protein phosphatase [Lachnospiraceae bacterium]
MIKILFVCHGNICRSPMAEFVMKDMVEKKGLQHQFHIASAATSTEEIGNPVHPGTRNKLKQYGISTAGKYAIQLKKSDYRDYDYLIGMEERNLTNMRRITGGDPDKKMHCLLDFSNHPRDIADPWYTGNFDLTYTDILEGCKAFLSYLENEKEIENEYNKKGESL